MDEWLDALARALGEDPLGRYETGAMLRLSREVAHATERRFAPLSTLLVGLHAGRLAAGGAKREEAIRRALEIAAPLLPGPPADGSER
jgi:hypothetical protein